MGKKMGYGKIVGYRKKWDVGIWKIIGNRKVSGIWEN